MPTVEFKMGAMAGMTFHVLNRAKSRSELTRDQCRTRSGAQFPTTSSELEAEEPPLASDPAAASEDE